MKKFIAALAFYLSLLGSAPAGVPCSVPFTLTNGTTADATQVMANYNAILTCLGNAAASGANVDITALLGLTTPLTPSVGGTATFIAGTSTGGANAQVVASTTPNTFALTQSFKVVFIAGFTNTGATTLNVHSTGATNVFRQTPTGLQALTGGEIVAGTVVEAVYDGTQFELLPGLAQFGGYGPLTNIASAATTDLGTLPSHNANVTGNVTITSFGSTANTTYPYYRITFAGGLTLTHNATSLILPGQANIVTATNDAAEAIFLGSGNWLITSYTKQNGTAVLSPTSLCGASGFSLQNNAGTPNTNLDIAADSAVMINPTGNVPFFATAIAATINTTNVGVVNGLDTGSRASSTWYNIFLISNGSTTGGLASLSATAPTMPSGFTFRCRLGAMFTDGSGNFFRSLQLGSRSQQVVGTNPTALRQIFSTSTTSVVGQSISNFVPPTAVEIFVVQNLNSPAADTQAGVAPNANYGAVATNPYPVQSTSLSGKVFQSSNASMLLESTSQIFSSLSVGSSTYTVALQGWRDKVNAN